MDKLTPRQIQAAKELRENIKAGAAGPQHRFELHDPFTETTHRFQIADAARAKAVELGAIQFQGRSADGATIQIKQTEGEWRADDGRTLADIQTKIDKESVAAIEARGALRAIAGSVAPATDRQMAQADIADAGRIQNLGRLELAFTEMSRNARASAQYKESLSDLTQGQGHRGASQKMEAIHRERVERVKALDPEEAARQAKRDSAELRLARTPEERFYLGFQIEKSRTANPHYHAELARAEHAAGRAAWENPMLPVVGRPERDDPVSAALNSIEPDRERKRERLADAEESARAARARGAADGQTVATGRVQAGGNKVESDEVFTATQRDKPVVPPEVERQFLRVGDKFYHPKNTDRVAFEDKGNKLETESNSKSIADAMVRIAEARGWDEIKISGSEVFRKEVWLEAASRGMHVKGYTPSELDQALLALRNPQKKNEKELVRARDSEPAEPGAKPDLPGSGLRSNHANRANESVGKIDNGILVEHGKAPYMHDKTNDMSYFVKTQDSQGNEQTTWGVDLKRAVKESGAKKGDRITLENQGQRLVTVNVRIRDQSGKVIGLEEKEVNRNTWNVQVSEAFKKEKPEDAIKKFPELAGAYAVMAAADKKSEADGFDEKQRAAIAGRVRQNVLNSIECGDMPEVKLKEQIEVKRERGAEREQSR